MNTIKWILMSAVAAGCMLLAQGCGSGNDDTPDAVTRIEFDEPEITIAVSQVEQLTYTIRPTRLQNSAVSFASSDAEVVYVTQTGRITGMAEGEATITVTATESGKKGQCVVTVEKLVPVTGITLKQKSAWLKKGNTRELEPVIAPADASNRKITWRSSNATVATVDDDGTVTAVGQGDAIITVTTDDGNHEDDCSVMVTEHDVYVIGVNGSGDTKLWINGIEENSPVAVSNMASSMYGFNSPLFVSDNDVYIAATDAVYKNGTATGYSGGGVGSICVSGDKVYAAGEKWNGDKPQAMIWYETAEAVALPTTATLSAGSSVFMTGNILYASGVIFKDVGGYDAPFPVYWKGSSASGMALTELGGTGASVRNGNARNIYISDAGTVYTAGQSWLTSGGDTYATVWEGTTPYYPSVQNGSNARKVMTSGSNVYVFGTTSTYVSDYIIWKKSGTGSYQATTLAPTGTNISVNDMFVADDVMYLVGYSGTGATRAARLWVNGKPVDLATGTNASARFVFVN